MEIKLNPNYWDCECSENYIHSKPCSLCRKCRAKVEDQPNARQEELKPENMAVGCCASFSEFAEELGYDKQWQDSYLANNSQIREHRISRILYVIYNAFGEAGAKIESDGKEKVLITFKDNTAMSIHIDYAE